MHPDTRLLKFNRVMDNQATRSESGDLSCVCSMPCTWGVVGRPPFRLFHPKLAEHFDAARLSMLSSMCQHVATSSNIAVVQMCRERLSRTGSFYSDAGIARSLRLFQLTSCSSLVRLTLDSFNCKWTGNCCLTRPLLVSNGRGSVTFCRSCATDPTKFILSAIDRTRKMTLASWQNRECSHDYSRECARFDAIVSLFVVVECCSAS